MSSILEKAAQRYRDRDIIKQITQAKVEALKLRAFRIMVSHGYAKHNFNLSLCRDFGPTESLGYYIVQGYLKYNATSIAIELYSGRSATLEEEEYILTSILYDPDDHKQRNNS